jgi:CubicO group peptidase (beta-lactamase class C family)
MVSYAAIKDGALLAQHAGKDIVPWWSFTKTALSAAALALVRDGQLELDCALENRPFTLRQLLRHEAGLPDYGQIDAYHKTVAAHEDPWTVEEMLRRANADRLLYQPGHGWRYSNIGFLYVRQLVEHATDKDLQSALRQLVFDPLGIAHARLASCTSDLQDVWMGETSGYDPRWVYHGLLVGPLEDAAALLNRLMSGRLLPAYLMDAMRDAHSVPGSHRPSPGGVPGRPWVDPGYGLGLMTGKAARGAEFVGHSGAGPGSVIAVYHCSRGATSVAAIAAGDDQALVEREVVRMACA